VAGTPLTRRLLLCALFAAFAAGLVLLLRDPAPADAVDPLLSVSLPVPVPSVSLPVPLPRPSPRVSLPPLPSPRRLPSPPVRHGPRPSPQPLASPPAISVPAAPRPPPNVADPAAAYGTSPAEYLNPPAEHPVRPAVVASGPVPDGPPSLAPTSPGPAQPNSQHRPTSTLGPPPTAAPSGSSPADNGAPAVLAPAVEMAQVGTARPARTWPRGRPVERAPPPPRP
jgi:hypothetical protein